MNENNRPKGMICLIFRIISLKLNKGFIAIVETIPTTKNSIANNPTNKYGLLIIFNILAVSGINDNITKTIKIFDELLLFIYYLSINILNIIIIDLIVVIYKCLFFCLNYKRLFFLIKKN